MHEHRNTQHNTRAQIKKRHALSPRTRARILTRDMMMCQYCHDSVAECVDHIIPYAYGGSDKDDNLVAACNRCNGSVSDKVFDSFADKQRWILAKIERRKKQRNKQPTRLTCADCGRGFAPYVDGASSLLCGKCYAK